jgi:hypothetical protein
MTNSFKLPSRGERYRAPLLLTLLALTVGACDNRLTNTSTEDLTDPTTVADPVAVADSTVPVDSVQEDVALLDSLAVEDSLATLGDPTGGLPIADEDEGISEEEEVDVGVEVVEGPDPAAEAAAATPAPGISFANAFRGGIAFGTFHLPKSLYGKTQNGSLANISASELRSYLDAARRSGTKVMIAFSGNEKHFKNSNRSFSLAKWKARVNRYRGLNLSSYIKDGTLMGHYLIDEPHDPSNWGGRTVSRAMVDQMAKYSKQLWPGLPTVARAWPKFLKGYRYRYLDAAWAQYSARFGSVSVFMKDNVRDAKASGLALVIGMNQLNGGNRSGGLRGFSSGYSMSARQLRSWGATMLANSYPCAFLSWMYHSRYMNRSDIKSANAYLAGKARSKGRKSCKG